MPCSKAQTCAASATGLSSFFLRVPLQQQFELQLRGRLGGWGGLAARENLPDPIGQGVESERGNAKEASRNNEEFLTENIELQFLPQEGRGEVSGGGHQQHEVLQALIAQNSNIFHVIALFDEAKSFLNFPARQINLHDPP